MSDLTIDHDGEVTHLRLMRPAKRNALNDALVAAIHTAFVNLPEATRAVVISGEGEHFCAGLDLSELSERSVAEGVAHALRDAGTPSLGHEGLREGQWALVDFGAVVLHVFHQFSRDVYRLEQMWEDAPMHVCAPAEPAAERRLGA